MLGDPMPPAGLQLLHADPLLLAFDKPSGLLSVPGRGPDKQDCLATRVQTHWPDARVVHRLDMATSGILLMARGADSQRQLGDAFARRLIDKRYEAIVDGWPDTDAGTIELPLIADWPNRPRQIVDPSGKPALTRWRVLSRDTDADGTRCARLALFPETGRSHQLRVHMQAIGHPILGDALYAGDAAHARAPRLLLHAAWIGFTHPGHGQRIELNAPLPF